LSKKPLTQGNTFISDKPSETDHLDFTPYVSALVDFIASPTTKTPLTLGIFGTWGSGKTTLMLLMEKDINGRFSDGKSPPFKSLWINVWQISQQEGGKKLFCKPSSRESTKACRFSAASISIPNYCSIDWIGAPYFVSYLQIAIAFSSSLRRSFWENFYQATAIL